MPGLDDSAIGGASTRHSENLAHYNGGRPHSRLGPGVSGPPYPELVNATPSNYRHRLAEGVAVRSKSVLKGLHHEYFLAPDAAKAAMDTLKSA